MNSNSFNSIPNNTTADCPICGHTNQVHTGNLQYFHDTLVPRGIYCSNCNHFLPRYRFKSPQEDKNTTTMFG